MAVDKELAQQYRDEGKTLQEVADLVGCSLSWCKANLKGTKRRTDDKKLIEDVRTKGRSKEATTSSEVRAMVKDAYPKLEGKELEEKVSDVKKAARRNNKDVLIRPYWMLPESARACTLDMLEYANEVWQLKEYLAQKYRRNHNLDSSYHNSVIYGLTMLSAGEYNKLMPQGLMTYGEQLESIYVELEDRHGIEYAAPQQTVEEMIPGSLVSLDDVCMWE